MAEGGRDIFISANCSNKKLCEVYFEAHVHKEAFIFL